MIIRNNTPSKISRSKFNKITYSFLVKVAILATFVMYLKNIKYEVI